MRRPHQKLVRRGAAEGGPEGTTHHSPPPHLPFSTYLPSNSCSNSSIFSESKSQSEISHAICVPFFLKKKKGPLLILLGQVVEMRSHVRRSTTPQAFGFLYLQEHYNAQHERGSGVSKDK